MIILGIDTSGRQGSVALLQAQGEEVVSLGVAEIGGRHYSELLIPSIAELLARNGLQRSDIGLVGVASGPGSFTGLRIAIATVKGLAEAFAMPVVAVSVLEAIVGASRAEGKVIAAVDAQRSEVFWGEYNVESATRSAAPSSTMLGEGIASFGEFASRLASGEASAKVFTPDEALAARLHEANADTEVLVSLSAESFARIAYRRYLAGARDDAAALDANYVRRSDAELFAAPKPGIARR